jgi:hypothetical protein
VLIDAQDFGDGGSSLSAPVSNRKPVVLQAMLAIEGKAWQRRKSNDQRHEAGRDPQRWLDQQQQFRRQAGEIMVTANRLIIDGAGSDFPTGVISQAEMGSTGDAGMVTIKAQQLELRDGGTISSSTFAKGNAAR